MRLVWLVTREQRKYIIVRHVPFDDDGTWRFDCVPPNCDACDECRLRYCCTSTRGALNITFSDYAYLVGSTKKELTKHMLYTKINILLTNLLLRCKIENVSPKHLSEEDKPIKVHINHRIRHWDVSLEG